MPGSQSEKSRSRHVPIFPPSAHPASKIDESLEPATARFQAAMDDPQTPERDGQEADPERWDGMS